MRERIGEVHCLEPQIGTVLDSPARPEEAAGTGSARPVILAVWLSIDQRSAYRGQLIDAAVHHIVSLEHDPVGIRKVVAVGPFGKKRYSG